jgi:hypothetical protein
MRGRFSRRRSAREGRRVKTDRWHTKICVGIVGERGKASSGRTPLGSTPFRESGRRRRRPCTPASTCRLPRASLHRQKTKGHQGGAPMAHRSAFRPAGVRPTRGSCCLAFASLPASLAAEAVGDHHQDQSQCRHFSSPPSGSVRDAATGSGMGASGLTSRPCRRSRTRSRRGSERELP